MKMLFVQLMQNTADMLSPSPPKWGTLRNVDLGYNQGLGITVHLQIAVTSLIKKPVLDVMNAILPNRAPWPLLIQFKLHPEPDIASNRFTITLWS